MSFLKALIPGFLLTWIVSGLLGSQGVRGGLAAIQGTYIEGHHFYWSWPLFCAATGVGWGIFLLMDA